MHPYHTLQIWTNDETLIFKKWGSTYPQTPVAPLVLGRCESLRHWPMLVHTVDHDVLRPSFLCSLGVRPQDYLYVGDVWSCRCKDEH